MKRHLFTLTVAAAGINFADVMARVTLRMPILERALVHLEGGTLEVRLPGGAIRRFGSGPVASMAIHDRTFFRRVATRGKLGVGESYTAGKWTSDDLVAFFELLLRNAEDAAERHTPVRRVLEARPRLNRRSGLLGARRNRDGSRGESRATPPEGRHSGPPATRIRRSPGEPRG